MFTKNLPCLEHTEAIPLGEAMLLIQLTGPKNEPSNIIHFLAKNPTLLKVVMVVILNQLLPRPLLKQENVKVHKNPMVFAPTFLLATITIEQLGSRTW